MIWIKNQLETYKTEFDGIIITFDDQNGIPLETEEKIILRKSLPCIIVKGTIDFLVIVANEDDKVEKKVAFKYNTPFSSCISKINNV